MDEKSSREGSFFAILCIIGAVAILSSTMSKNPVLNPFAESLNTPEALMGTVAAASTVPGVLISLPAGSLSDVLGRRKVLLFSSVIFATAPFLYILINSWWQLVLVRFYHGFATAIFVPVARAAIAELFPSSRGEKISTFTSATIVGRASAPFLGGFILSITVWNFKTLYLAVGVAGVTAFLVTLLLLKESRFKEKMASVKTDSTSIMKGLEVVVSSRGIMTAGLVEASARYSYGALEFFLVGYLKNVVMLDPFLIGVITGSQLVFIPIINPFMGRLSDKIGRRIPIITGLLLGTASLSLIPFVRSFPILLLISIAYGLSYSMVTSSAPALVGDLARKDTYGAAMGFLAMIMDIGQMLGPVITGLILSITIGYTYPFISLGLILLFSCLIFWLATLHLERES
ncbi:MFS transporter [Candidatus Bathyarchaeota archaeon]|nr:MAG: MFS transporter [Candidatus Bathyarchaeota archaeon]